MQQENTRINGRLAYSKLKAIFKQDFFDVHIKRTSLVEFSLTYSLVNYKSKSAGLSC
jgi:hypothetical protein